MKIKVYFLEIKNRLFLLLLTWLTVLSVCYTFKEILLFVFIKQSTHFNEPFYFIFTDVAEIFFTYSLLIIFLSNHFLLFYLFYHIFVFSSSGLFSSEHSYVTFVFKMSFFCFIFSVSVYCNIFFPTGWTFFLSFQKLSIIKLTTLHFESKLSEFLLFYTSFYYSCILYFQILIILFIIFYTSNMKKELPKKFRKFVYYFFVIFSTLVTPPDVFNQMFLSICLIFGYETLVFYIICEKIYSKKSF